MQEVKLNSVSAVLTDTGRTNWYATDSEGRLWKGYNSQAGQGEVIWEQIKRPEVADQTNEQDRVRF